MFWWIFAVIAGIVVLGAAGWYLACHVDARRCRAGAAIAARADEQHAQVLAGDDRGIYGDYVPTQID